MYGFFVVEIIKLDGRRIIYKLPRNRQGSRETDLLPNAEGLATLHESRYRRYRYIEEWNKYSY